MTSKFQHRIPDSDHSQVGMPIFPTSSTTRFQRVSYSTVVLYSRDGQEKMAALCNVWCHVHGKIDCSTRREGALEL